MNKTNLKKAIYIFLLLPMIASADVPSWKIIPNESSLTFIATQTRPVTSITNFLVILL